MAEKFIAVFGSYFKTYPLEFVLDTMADEEISYWFAKCGGPHGNRGRKAFWLLFLSHLTPNPQDGAKRPLVGRNGKPTNVAADGSMLPSPPVI